MATMPARLCQEISSPLLLQKMQHGEALTLIDVREPHEYKRGHIPGARLIPLSTISHYLQELSRKKNIVLICRSGQRSSLACQLLAKAGIPSTNLMGGMQGWLGPVER